MARAIEVHVGPHKGSGGWEAYVVGKKRGVIRSTQSAAEFTGRMWAQVHKGELVLHGRDGRIRRKDSYGNDPRTRKG